jgi:hypothetical protein
MYLNVLVDMGVPGAVVVVVMIIAAVVTSLWATSRASPGLLRALVITQIAMLSCWIVYGFTGNQQYSNYAYLLLACNFLLPDLLRNEAARSQSTVAG